MQILSQNRHFANQEVMPQLETEHAAARPWLVQAGKERASERTRTDAAAAARRTADTCANGGGGGGGGEEWDFGKKKFSKSDAERRPQRIAVNVSAGSGTNTVSLK